MRYSHWGAIALCIIGLVRSLHGQQKQDALVLYREGRYAEAVETCLRELEQYGVDDFRSRMDAYSVLGWSYIRMGEYQNALNYAREARNEVRGDPRIVEIEAEALFYLGRNLESLALFEEYVSLNSTGNRIDVVYYFMGELFLRLAEFSRADIAFSTALYYSPQVARWWARLGYAKEQNLDIEGAAQAYTRALELLPSLEEAKVGLERIQG
ncbi:TPR domain protein [Olavius algarvensis spirochete endosymbiont]|uniref:tetratricopeptide repeat protein n=1 Tax=Olavius algarvensis spirochete endosymbiont TaxID=260710 RepID=UPI00052B9D7C|nr:tetratricopeptide repeat protein [Olavius algarvensis spirochete endosymbiont]KGM43897.1 hypothetical protein JY97_04255 [Alkalispirochaeta odontotermitis]VDB01290.1 TPR domain protein [Olavius algarvensis spirochete endosymbiont]